MNSSQSTDETVRMGKDPQCTFAQIHMPKKGSASCSLPCKGCMAFTEVEGPVHQRRSRSSNFNHRCGSAMQGLQVIHRGRGPDARKAQTVQYV